jgi:fibronectin-binding autotransporter adhesin
MYSVQLGENAGLGNGPFNFNQGTVILLSGNLFAGVTGGMNNNLTVLRWDTSGDKQTPAETNGTIACNIAGAGPIEVDSGTLTLSGNNTYTGTNILKGGKLIAGSVETANPSGPLGEPANPGDQTISFQGGILGFSTVNGFDYSPRFDTSPGQQYKIDTASANVTMTNALTSSGGTFTKFGSGSLTLSGANTYSGLTRVSAGKLVIAGTQGSGNISVDDGAALGVTENGTPLTPATLTLGTSFGATLEANNVTNETAAPLATPTLVSAGTLTVNANNGRFRTIGQTFPLLAWTSGTPPATTLGFLGGAGGHLTTNLTLNGINLVIDQPPFIWTGNNNGSWNTTTPNNWVFSGSSATWINGNFALFDDSLSANSSVTISGVLSGQTITFDNFNTNYTLNSVDVANNLGGTTSLTMAGGGTTTLAGGANTYTGVTTITGGGTLSVGTLANGGIASDIGASANSAANLVLNNGTLVYTGGGATSDRLFTLGTGGGTIDNEGVGTLTLNNSGSIGLASSGPRTLTLTGIGTADTFASVLGDGGGPTTLLKNGAGTWILTGTSTYSGGTEVEAGQLNVGNGGSSGNLGLGPVIDGTAVDINRTGTLTVPGAISGVGSVTIDGPGTVILANNNIYRGGTTINAGTLQVGNGGGTGSLYINGGIVDNSLLVINTSGTFNYLGAGAISGPGNVIIQGGGFQSFIGANSYTGWTRIDANTTLKVSDGNTGTLTSSVVTNNGTLRLVRQDVGVFTYGGPIVGTGRLQVGANNNNVGDMTLTASNSFTGGIFIGGNTLILGDNLNPGSGAFVGNVTFVNNFQTGDDQGRTLVLNRMDDYTISGNIVTNFASPQTARGTIQLAGSATVTLTGNNTYGGGTVINNGALRIGNGGGSGSVGFGPVTLNSGNPLVINRTGSLSIPGAITGGAGVTLINSGTVTLSSTGNAYTGDTTVSNGTLVATSVGGTVNLEGGTLVVQGIGSAAVLTVPGNLNLDSGTVVASLNTAQVQSNTFYAVTGVINSGTPVTLKLLNAGPLPVAGSKFTIFSTPVTNVTVFSPGMTVQNDLAVDGSVTLLTVAPAPQLSVSLSGNTLNLTWPATWTGGVHLQGQTNALTKGLSGNWVTIPGSDLSNVFTTQRSTNAVSVFFRLIMP